MTLSVFERLPGRAALRRLADGDLRGFARLVWKRGADLALNLLPTQLHERDGSVPSLRCATQLGAPLPGLLVIIVGDATSARTALESLRASDYPVDRGTLIVDDAQQVIAKLEASDAAFVLLLSPHSFVGPSTARRLVHRAMTTIDAGFAAWEARDLERRVVVRHDPVTLEVESLSLRCTLIARGPLGEALRDRKARALDALTLSRRLRAQGRRMGFVPDAPFANAAKGVNCRVALSPSRALVSIVVRSVGRPAQLREALTSIANQTYPNIEVVVVEDGPPTCSFLADELVGLPVHWIATGERVGRCRAGNIGLTRARGDYLAFLDDDDLFYADHVEALVEELERSPMHLAAYAVAEEQPLTVVNTSPLIYRTGATRIRHREPFDRGRLEGENYLPITTVLFRRRLFEWAGGLNEDLDLLEDWDLWRRYARHTDFIFVDRVTGLYRVPLDAHERRSRQRRLDAARAAYVSRP
jgi:hypothetical protein